MNALSRALGLPTLHCISGPLSDDWLKQDMYDTQIRTHDAHYDDRDDGYWILDPSTCNDTAVKCMMNDDIIFLF